MQRATLIPHCGWDFNCTPVRKFWVNVPLASLTPPLQQMHCDPKRISMFLQDVHVRGAGRLAMVASVRMGVHAKLGHWAGRGHLPALRGTKAPRNHCACACLTPWDQLSQRSCSGTPMLFWWRRREMNLFKVLWTFKCPWIKKRILNDF